MKHSAVHPVTLGQLHPKHRLGEKKKSLAQSKRSHGSHSLSLRTPDRMAEYSRPYMPGDPLKKIDWKVFARTDELIVREHKETAAVRVRVFLDLGESMSWPRKNMLTTNYIQKSELGIRIAYHLAYFHSLFGDQIEFCFEVLSLKLTFYDYQ